MEVALENLKKILAKIRKNIVFILILVLTITYVYINNNNIKSVSLGEQLYTFSSTTKPIVNSNFDNSFFLTTSVETKYFDANGKEKLAVSTLFTDPITSFSEKYLAVWNKKSIGNIMVINNKDGLVYEVSNNNTVLDVSINKNGYMVVLLKDVTNSGYVFNVYNNLGQSVASRVCDTENNFPISVSISEDNRIVSLCEIDTNSLEAKSYVSLSYVDEKDNKELNSAFTGVTFNNEIVGDITFSKNYLLAYTKETIHILAINNDTISESATIKVNNEISFAQIVNDKYLAISLASPINSQAIDANTLQIYSFGGDLKSETKLENIITNVTPADNSVIIVCGRNVKQIDVNGEQVFSYSHSKDIVNSYYIGKKIPAIIVENNGIYSIVKGQ